MRAKYYIPTIEEFYVGFEYQIINGYEWFDKIFSKEDLKSFLYEELENGLKQQYLRVKYLDKSDIESLLWRPLMLEGTRAFLLNDNGDVYFLNIIPADKMGVRLQIAEVPGEKLNDKFVIFSGWIKNISELKVLMKQLEIGKWE